MVVFIKHIDIEGPGTIADFLEDNRIDYTVIDLPHGDTLPKAKKTIHSVVCLGGPMNVYEEEKYPFLAEEDCFLKELVKKDVPFLGICLGAQLIVKATNARVTKNPQKEIGWYKITLSDDGLKDDLFKGFPEDLMVFQWHGDTFDIPDGGKRLASSELCQNQVVKQGRNMYGIQFHVEITRGMIAQWADAYKEELDSLEGIVSGKQKMLEDYDSFATEYLKQAERFYINFFHTAGLLKKKFISYVP
ncbi:MAG: type 1 glutamine amidotransferase [Candidatus Brocadiaceae bacterium]|nr:type 1 glutamine amidotransferase [Candidatus Brocadiaceae bacterium]